MEDELRKEELIADDGHREILWVKGIDIIAGHIIGDSGIPEPIADDLPIYPWEVT